ncbi:SDR family oxidoreductase [Desulfonatronospira thiodismutans]|uniref:SDR family oxidoreductase n=1 Tax=Desulfonatronospira thiodismutans TaxID=488939 RepID=UPI001FCA000A|nr:NmrA family NAD(P)-binding protein [Desulfonatronospira thiodismutans]
MTDKPILVTGATGYIGGRLIPVLLEKGFRVRAVARSPVKLSCRPWARDPGVENAVADMQDRSSLMRAARGVQCGLFPGTLHESSGSPTGKSGSAGSQKHVLGSRQGRSGQNHLFKRSGR